MRASTRGHLWKGFVSGAVGGLVASFAMGQIHSLFQKPESPPRRDQEDSTVKVATAISRSIFHRDLSEQQKELAAPAVHYGFGASLAGVYGTLVEAVPLVRIGWGVPFGAAVWLGAHVITVPALGLSAPITQSSTLEQAVEFGAHLVYGIVVESFRRLLRLNFVR